MAETGFLHVVALVYRQGSAKANLPIVSRVMSQRSAVSVCAIPPSSMRVEENLQAQIGIVLSVLTGNHELWSQMFSLSPCLTALQFSAMEKRDPCQPTHDHKGRDRSRRCMACRGDQSRAS